MNPSNISNNSSQLPSTYYLTPSPTGVYVGDPKDKTSYTQYVHHVLESMKSDPSVTLQTIQANIAKLQILEQQVDEKISESYVRQLAHKIVSLWHRFRGTSRPNLQQKFTELQRLSTTCAQWKTCFADAKLSIDPQSLAQKVSDPFPESSSIASSTSSTEASLPVHESLLPSRTPISFTIHDPKGGAARVISIAPYSKKEGLAVLLDKQPINPWTLEQQYPGQLQAALDKLTGLKKTDSAQVDLSGSQMMGQDTSCQPFESECEHYFQNFKQLQAYCTYDLDVDGKWIEKKHRAYLVDDIWYTVDALTGVEINMIRVTSIDQQDTTCVNKQLFITHDGSNIWFSTRSQSSKHDLTTFKDSRGQTAKEILDKDAAFTTHMGIVRNLAKTSSQLTQLGMPLQPPSLEIAIGANNNLSFSRQAFYGSAWKYFQKFSDLQKFVAPDSRGTGDITRGAYPVLVHGQTYLVECISTSNAECTLECILVTHILSQCPPFTNGHSIQLAHAKIPNQSRLNISIDGTSVTPPTVCAENEMNTSGQGDSSFALMNRAYMCMAAIEGIYQEALQVKDR